MNILDEDFLITNPAPLHSEPVADVVNAVRH